MSNHTVELSLVPPGYQVNPIVDLRPVCPNCHAMLHRTIPALSVDELRQILDDQAEERRFDRADGDASSSSR